MIQRENSSSRTTSRIPSTNFLSPSRFVFVLQLSSTSTLPLTPFYTPTTPRSAIRGAAHTDHPPKRPSHPSRHPCSTTRSNSEHHPEMATRQPLSDSPPAYARLPLKMYNRDLRPILLITTLFGASESQFRRQSGNALIYLPLSLSFVLSLVGRGWDHLFER